MPTQRKSAKSSRKSSSKSTGSSSKKPASKSRSSSRSRTGSSGSKSRSGARGQSQASSRSRSQGTSRSSAAKRSSSRRGKTPNALELLTEDHRNVQKMFRKAARLESGDRQLQEIVETTCAALTQHAEIEEQLFYPALQEQGNDQDIVQEALVEHDSAKQLIAQLQSMGARDERYKATFKVLGEYVNHHIEEEESDMFREARRAKIDLEALGEQILMIKQGGEAMGDTGESQATSSRRGGSSAKRSSSSGDSASSNSGSRGRSGSSRASSSGRQGSSGSDSRSTGESDSQSALDDESESTTAMSRTGGDSSEDTERPGRGGRRARSAGEGADDDEIDVETPGSSRFGSH